MANTPAVGARCGAGRCMGWDREEEWACSTSSPLGRPLWVEVACWGVEGAGGAREVVVVEEVEEVVRRGAFSVPREEWG